jgi:hypothetical protein
MLDKEIVGISTMDHKLAALFYDRIIPLHYESSESPYLRIHGAPNSIIFPVDFEKLTLPDGFRGVQNELEADVFNEYGDDIYDEKCTNCEPSLVCVRRSCCADGLDRLSMEYKVSYEQYMQETYGGEKTVVCDTATINEEAFTMAYRLKAKGINAIPLYKSVDGFSFIDSGSQDVTYNTLQKEVRGVKSPNIKFDIWRLDP